MRVLLVGAEGLGRVVAHELLQDGHDVRMLDASRERLDRLPVALEGRATHGSPLDRATLAEALHGCDGVASLTGDDAVNVVVALAARRELRVPAAVAVVADPGRAEALSNLGAHIVCPTAHTAREVHHTLVRSDVERELELGAGAAVFRIELPVRFAGRPLSQLALAGRVAPVALERRGRVHLAAADLEVEPGDVLHAAALDRAHVIELSRP